MNDIERLHVVQNLAEMHLGAYTKLQIGPENLSPNPSIQQEIVICQQVNQSEHGALTFDVSTNENIVLGQMTYY